MNDFSERVANLSPAKLELLTRRLKGKNGARTPALTRSERGYWCPLSYGQERLWFLSQLEPENPAYNAPAALRLSGPLDALALERSINEIVRRHEILRTSVSQVNDQPVQVISPFQARKLTVVDLQALPDPKAEARRLFDEEAVRPFDPRRAPLFRITLLRLAEREHVLLLIMHHLISDGWSLGVFIRELRTLYTSASLPELPLQYGDFAAWQRELLQGETVERQVDYWRARLGGNLSGLQLPTDYARPPVHTFNGARESLTISKELTESLQDLSRREGVTLFMTLLSAFKILLRVQTGQDDVIVGTPIANRTQPQTENLIGFFINTLVLRTDLAGDPTFTHVLGRVRETALGAYAHQDLPFEKLVETLQPRREMSLSPLFQVMFNFQDKLESFDMDAIAIEFMEPPSGVAKFDLTFEVSFAGEQLRASAEYNTDLFKGETIVQLLERYQRLLAAIVENSWTRLSELPLLSEAEIDALVVQPNQTAVETVAGTFMQLFEQHVAQQPDALALVCGNEQLSYQQLNERANQLAHYLRALGVGPDVLVGIMLERGVDLIVSIVAVLKAGGAYLPLDAAYPLERLAFMIDDAGLTLLLTQERLLARLPTTDVQIICVDHEAETLRQQSIANPSPLSGGNNLAYVIYTSGSTGQPKGVLLEHHGLANLAQAQAREFELHSGKRVLQFASQSFDASVWELVMALGSGATLCLAEQQQALLEAAEVERLVTEQQITHVTLPPSLLEVLPERALSSLQVIVSAGERCRPELVQRWGKGRAFYNAYGPTETTVCATWQRCEHVNEREEVPIGKPIPNHRVYVLNSHLQPVPAGVAGELFVGGAGLARGYLRRPELTAERFVPDPFASEPGGRLYRTGDLVRWRADGLIEYVGRRDQQVKVRGYRVELGEIEAALRAQSGVQDCVVVHHGSQLLAYVAAEDVSTTKLRARLKEQLPDYMVPGQILLLPQLPLTASGKIDKRALPVPQVTRAALNIPYVAPQTEIERSIAAAWQDALRVDTVGTDDNFFDLGGHSLLLLKIHQKLQDTLKRSFALIDLLRYPTIASLARHLAGVNGQPKRTIHTASGNLPGLTGKEIAVIGMSLRVPGAKNVEQYWDNLAHGVESITRFSDRELIAAGVSGDTLRDPSYVKAKGVLGDIELFDAPFFGYYPREAELMDPQHRLLLECAWESLEDAGYDPQRYAGAIGLFAGTGMNTYLLNCIFANQALARSLDPYQYFIQSDKDFLATRISYKLNLRGPSLVVQTACSTSLVAVHLACQSLLTRQSDMALAGGVAIHVPEVRGYLYQDGGVASPDGHCRAFDAHARGTIGGNGLGLVVLKRLQDALDDGDQIYALIKGSAINNDGANKVGYTAPSVEGQAAVIEAALASAEVDAATVNYVEAHGTGTVLGDPIEIAALTEAFRRQTDETNFCAIGSVKTNVGHLDAAAGVAGLIKTVLALKHKSIPPSLHFTSPNPHIDFAASPFYVNAKLSDWPRAGNARRAGVSSFGIGGTNAHVVLEEAELQSATTASSRRSQLLLLSAKTAAALDTATSNLARHLTAHPDVDLADVAYTLQVGRRAFPFRRALVCENTAEAVQLLEQADAQRVVSGAAQENRPQVVFMFPGQGAQHAQMGRELYDAEESFRRDVDHCAELLQQHDDFDLRQALFAHDSDLTQTSLAQPALFVIEYALARLWMRWGVQPSAMIGHSIGEYTAACLAGVFSLEDALRLVALRGRLMQSLPPGAMLAISLGAREVQSLPSDGLSLAAVNGPANCVVSGSLSAIGDLERKLQDRQVSFRRLHTSHAFHSEMVEPVLAEFAAHVKRVSLSPPQIPYLSNVTGNWITAAEATSVDYWTTHLRQTVRFSEGLSQLSTDSTLLEVGPGQTLTTLARQNERLALASMRAPRQQQSDLSVLLLALGRLWLSGVEVDWTGFYGDEKRRRVSLPSYPFERQYYWIQPEQTDSVEIGPQFYAPSWKQTPLLPCHSPADQSGMLVLFGDDSELIADLAERLKLEGRNVETVLSDRNEGFYELLRLAQSLGKRDLAAPVHLFVITDNLHALTGAEPLSPRKALIQPLCKIIPQEYPGITCRNIDLAATDVEHLYRELTADVSDSVVAYRGRQRWVKTFEPLKISVSDSTLREHGGYLITGGLGRIGLALAQHLAETVNARVILVGRSAPPDKRPWDEWSGGEVTYVQADVVDMDQMRAVFETIDELHGVVHAAGLVGAEWLRPIAQTDKAFCEAHFRPKIEGALVLRELLRERKIDWCVLLSSLSTILGGLGYAAYAAANSFLDALALEVSESRKPWLSLNLDGWTNADEGVQIFQRALTLLGIAPQIVVSNGELAGRINRAERLEDQEATARRRNLASERVKQSDNGYVSDLERDVARVWAEAFGFDSIGANENFFELGGDSLLATQINARLKRALQIDLSLETFFASPTVAGLAHAILQQQSEQDESAKSELLKLLEGLSEDEIDAELLKRTQQLSAQ